MFPSLRAGRPALLLAPMEGVTDAPMRAVLSERGGFTFCVGEFLRVSQCVPPAKVYYAHLPELAHGGVTEANTPVQLQLLGGDPERLAEAALRGVEHGAKAVDLNFGCPAKTVNRHDGGATLLKHPDRLRTIVSALRAALPPEIPVSAKLRLGWDNAEPVHHNADMAAEGGAAWITIHGRTKVQGYAPPVDWSSIGAVKRRLGDLPVVANGDIWTREDFLRCRDVTGSEHFMIGRGALANPHLQWHLAHELGLEGGRDVGDFSGAAAEWVSLLERFVELSFAGGFRSQFILRRTKQWLRMAGACQSVPWFDSYKRAQELSEALEILRSAAAPQVVLGGVSPRELPSVDA